MHETLDLIGLAQLEATQYRDNEGVLHNLCPKCSEDWGTLRECITSDEPENRDIAQLIIYNCPACYQHFRSWGWR